MKKILFTICLTIGALACFAQTETSPIVFGIKAGVNFSNLHQTIDGASGSISSGSISSFNAGVFADFRTDNSFSIQPQLLYTGKGANDKRSVAGQYNSSSSNIELNLYYLHLPVYVVYHIPVRSNSFFIGAGPFGSYGLNGSENGTITSTFQQAVPPNFTQTVTRTNKIDHKVNYGSSDSSDVKRMDYGASVMAGFRFKNGFLISACYDLGLSNIAPSDADVKTRVFSVSLEYSF
ncbi:MAG: porin family protein [Mucilaginibacter sp.]